jgi:hypothetical protein
VDDLARRLKLVHDIAASGVLVHDTELNLLVEWNLVHGTSFSRTESGAWHGASHFGITKRLKL